MESALRAIGNIPDMAAEGALVPVLDLSAEAEVVATANGRDEVGGVKRIDGQPGISAAGVVGALLDQLVIGVVDFVVAELSQGEGSLITIERNVAGGI